MEVVEDGRREVPWWSWEASYAAVRAASSSSEDEESSFSSWLLLFEEEEESEKSESEEWRFSAAWIRAAMEAFSRARASRRDFFVKRMEP